LRFILGSHVLGSVEWRWGSWYAVIEIIYLKFITDALNATGYTFWTTNKHYHRLGTLYTMIFGENYRETIAKDGLSSYLQTGIFYA
jgi:hypothetical protein